MIVENYSRKILQTSYHLLIRAVTSNVSALAALAAQKFCFACLWVLEENHAARRFYEKQGFCPCEGRMLFSEEGIREIRYVRSLASL